MLAVTQSLSFQHLAKIECPVMELTSQAPATASVKHASGQGITMKELQQQVADRPATVQKLHSMVSKSLRFQSRRNANGHSPHRAVQTFGQTTASDSTENNMYAIYTECLALPHSTM